MHSDTGRTSALAFDELQAMFSIDPVHVTARHASLQSLLWLFLALCSDQVSAQVISTAAGDGSGTYAGDGGPAVQAGLFAPTDIAFDGNGNYYIMDTGNGRVRKVSPDGVIATVAGNGIQGFSGDGGPATEASLNWATSIALDAAGNIYVADRFNHRVRRIGTDGIISTVAGSGLPTGDLGDGGPATQARLNYPWRIAIGPDDRLYIADREHNRIRKVAADGSISTIAGDGSRGYSGDGGPAVAASITAPMGMAFDRAGNLYFADYFNGHVRKISADGIISNVAGITTVQGGASTHLDHGNSALAVSTRLFTPTDIRFDPHGNLYITTESEDRILRLTPDGMISIVAGIGRGYGGDGAAATEARFNHPTGMAFDADGNLYVADSGNHRIRKITGMAIPMLSLSDATVIEGHGGAKAAIFTASLPNAAGPGGVGFDFSTGAARTNGRSATPGIDYAATSFIGRTIPEGQTSTTITIKVFGDRITETDEHFSVRTSNVHGALSSAVAGQGNILDDDPAWPGIGPVRGASSSANSAAMWAAHDCRRLATDILGIEEKTAAGQLPQTRGIESILVLEARRNELDCAAMQTWNEP